MRMPGLDSLRALAIVWVMLFHSFVVGGLGDSHAWLSRFGWMGVDLFFVLSGFLIGGQVLAPLARGEPLSLRDFYLRRAQLGGPGLPAFIVYVLLAVAGGALLHYLVERPFLAVRQRVLATMHAPEQFAPAL